MPLYLRTLISAMHFYLVSLNIKLIAYRKFTMPRRDLHWLPAVTFRIQFKLLLLVYKSLDDRSPSHIKDHLSLKAAGNYSLRPSAQSLLFVPEVNCSTLRDRTFAHTAPVLWNSLSLYHKNKLQSCRFFSFAGMVLIFSVKLLWNFRISFFYIFHGITPLLLVVLRDF